MFFTGVFNGHSQLLRQGGGSTAEGNSIEDLLFFMHFCPGTITTHAESINSDLQRGLDRRLRHIQH